jgi:light-regulated signal transduction histidine kinase (bacteriophytochrome)
MSERLSADDFFTGLFAALALKGKSAFTLRSTRFDEAVAEAYRELREQASDSGVDVRFRIRLHPLYGDSTTIRDSLTRAAQRDLISFDNPEYQDVRLKLSSESAELFLEGLPLRRELYLHLADRFLAFYHD